MMIGNEIRIKRLTLLINKKLHIAFYPQIEIDGEYCYIKDADSASGLVEDECIVRAKQKGETALEKTRKSLKRLSCNHDTITVDEVYGEQFCEDCGCFID